MFRWAIFNTLHAAALSGLSGPQFTGAPSGGRHYPYVFVHVGYVHPVTRVDRTGRHRDFADVHRREFVDRSRYTGAALRALAAQRFAAAQRRKPKPRRTAA